MNKYLCSSCNSIFLHAAKRITQTQEQHIVTRQFTVVNTEVYCCPYCFSNIFVEYKEPLLNLISHKEVAHADVDQYLKNGYVKVESYAKGCIMHKYSSSISDVLDEPIVLTDEPIWCMVSKYIQQLIEKETDNEEKTRLTNINDHICSSDHKPLETYLIFAFYTGIEYIKKFIKEKTQPTSNPTTTEEATV